MTTRADRTARPDDRVLAPAVDRPPVAADARLTPAEMAAATGLTIDTLRYYEAEGLLSGVERAGNGHRRYRREDVVWVEVLRCLRTSGMGIEQLRRYVGLVLDGPGTEAARLDQLLAHREEVHARLHELHAALDVIEHKIATYHTALGLAGTEPHHDDEETTR